jgi:hypothetical protein
MIGEVPAVLGLRVPVGTLRLSVNVIPASDMLLMMIKALYSGLVDGKTKEGVEMDARERDKEREGRFRICLCEAHLQYGGSVSSFYVHTEVANKNRSRGASRPSQTSKKYRGLSKTPGTPLTSLYSDIVGARTILTCVWTQSCRLHLIAERR